MNYRLKLSTIVMCLFAMVVIAGCAKTKIERSSPVVTEKIPKPATVWVYPFAAWEGRSGAKLFDTLKAWKFIQTGEAECHRLQS